MDSANRSTSRRLRELPPGLSDEQRGALSEFYAGYITAGQLCERLALTRGESPPSFTVDRHTSGFPARGGQRGESAPGSSGLGAGWRTWLIALIAACAAGGAVGTVIGRLGFTAIGHPGAARDSRVIVRTNPVQHTRRHARTAVARAATSRSAGRPTGAGAAVDAQARVPTAVSRTRRATSTTTNSCPPAPTPRRVPGKLPSAGTAPAGTTSTSTTVASGTATTTTAAPVATTTIITPSASTTLTGPPQRHRPNPGQHG
jgi:hypothetical protein